VFEQLGETELLSRHCSNLNDSMRAMHKQVQACHDHHRDKSKGGAAAVRRASGAAINFAVGDFVLLARVGKGKKLAPRWRGPMRVIEQSRDMVYKVQDLVTGMAYEAHAERLRFYHDASLNQTASLLAATAAANEGFEIDEILSHELPEAGVPHLLISWKGFGAEEHTLEGLVQVHSDAPTPVERYVRSLLKSEDPEVRKEAAILALTIAMPTTARINKRRAKSGRGVAGARGAGRTKGDDEAPVKRGRGRPKGSGATQKGVAPASSAKKGPGRPRKSRTAEEQLVTEPTMRSRPGGRGTAGGRGRGRGRPTSSGAGRGGRGTHTRSTADGRPVTRARAEH
jgi:hypothetical protein